MSEQNEARQLTYVAAITEGVRTVMLEQDNAFIAGEDVAQAGSVFGYYRGLLAEFGERRVVDTPISEKGIMGIGIGAAATGCRPILDIMFMDFMTECMDEIANQMAKMRYMFGGSATLPITVLTMSGGGNNMAAQHSQSLEAWLAHLPGVKVVMPTNAYDAKGLIIAAARDDNPVFVLLNKGILGQRTEVPEEAYEVPIGTANVVREGSNYTIVALGRMVGEAVKAADELSSLGLDVEIVDVRSIQPLDTATIVTSVEKTHRVLVAHEAVRFGGFGGEITAQIQELAFDYLDAPIARVGAPHAPMPYNDRLELETIPSQERITDAVRELMQ